MPVMDGSSGGAVWVLVRVGWSTEGWLGFRPLLAGTGPSATEGPLKGSHLTGQNPRGDRSARVVVPIERDSSWPVTINPPTSGLLR